MGFSGYNETILRGSGGFPIELYTVDKNHPRHIMPLHWHRELELIHIVSGRFILSVNNMPYHLKEGDIAIVSCGLLHRGEPDSEPCLYECIVGDLKALLGSEASLISSRIDPITSGSLIAEVILPRNSSALYSAAASLFSVLQHKQDYYELNAVGLLYRITEQLYLESALSAVTASKRCSHRSTSMAELVSWIEENHGESIDLRLLSKRSGMSPNYLCRVFKEFTGKTPIEYVNSVRIENICYDISSSKSSITEAATLHGFNDISYFCKVFKKYTGVSAKEYAKQHKK